MTVRLPDRLLIQAILSRVEKGGVGDFSALYPGTVNAPSQRVVVDADDVRAAILSKCDNHGCGRDVLIKHARIGGSLQLEQAVHGGSLTFVNCWFCNGVDLRHSHFRRLHFTGCKFSGPLEADVCEVDGDFIMTCCKAISGLSFTAAEVGGRFVVDNVDIGRLVAPSEDPQGRAFQGNMLVVRSGLFFRKGTSASGTIDLDGAVVDGNVEFEGVKIQTDGAPALYMGDAAIEGSVLIRESCEFSGTVDMFAMRARLLLIENSEIGRGSCKTSPGLQAESVRIETYVTLGSGAKLDGINFSSAQIGSALHFGAKPSMDKSLYHYAKVNVRGCVDLSHARVGRLNVDLEAWRDCGARHWLDGCQIGSFCTQGGLPLAAPEIEQWLGPNVRVSTLKMVAKALWEGGDVDKARHFEKKYWERISLPVVQKTWGRLTGYGHGSPLPVAKYFLAVFFISNFMNAVLIYTGAIRCKGYASSIFSRSFFTRWTC